MMVCLFPFEQIKNVSFKNLSIPKSSQLPFDPLGGPPLHVVCSKLLTLNPAMTEGLAM